jgi:hypothetical protein
MELGLFFYKGLDVLVHMLQKTEVSISCSLLIVYCHQFVVTSLVIMVQIILLCAENQLNEIELHDR